jgi:hypothetical protein
MRFHVSLQAEANKKIVQPETGRSLGDDPRFGHRGLVSNTIAWLGSTLIRMGTSLERLSPGRRENLRGYVSDQGCSNDSDEIRKEMTA